MKKRVRHALYFVAGAILLSICIKIPYCYGSRERLKEKSLSSLFNKECSTVKSFINGVLTCELKKRSCFIYLMPEKEFSDIVEMLAKDGDKLALWGFVTSCNKIIGDLDKKNFAKGFLENIGLLLNNFSNEFLSKVSFALISDRESDSVFKELMVRGDDYYIFSLITYFCKKYKKPGRNLIFSFYEKTYSKCKTFFRVDSRVKKYLENYVVTLKKTKGNDC